MKKCICKNEMTAHEYKNQWVCHRCGRTEPIFDDSCEYCAEYEDPCEAPMIAIEDSESDRGIYLYNNYLCADGGEYCEAKINFCPMCGRELSN